MQTHNENHAIHRVSYRHRERIVGVFVLIAGALFLLQLVLSDQLSNVFAQTHRFSTELQNPIGINQDTRVRVSGLDVGWVDEVTLTAENTFVIELKIYEKFRNLIRTDSRASISKLAVVGDSIINITPGSTRFEVLAQNSRIPSEESMSMDDLVTRLQPVLEQTESSVIKLASILAAIPEESVPNMLSDVQASLANLRNTSENIANGEGSLGALLMSNETNQRVQANLKASQNLFGEGQKALAQVNQNLATLPELITKLDLLISQLSEASDDIPSLIEDTNRLVNDSNNVVDDISETWPISTIVDPDPDHEATHPILPAN